MSTPSSEGTPCEGFVPLASQVGGHPGVMASEDGSLIIKPALPVEVAFYQSVLSDPAFEALRPYIPQFYGTLRLEGQVDPEKSKDGSIAVKEDSATDIAGVEKDEYTPAQAASLRGTNQRAYVHIR